MSEEKVSVSLVVGMTDRDVVERLREVTGLGVLRGPVEREGYKAVYFWSVYRPEHVQALLAAWWPWLGVRRRGRAREAIELIRRTERRVLNGEACTRGHEWTESNTYWYERPSDGKRIRYCKSCRSTWPRQDYRRRRELSKEPLFRGVDPLLRQKK